MKQIFHFRIESSEANRGKLEEMFHSRGILAGSAVFLMRHKKILNIHLGRR
jgi:hypothetical protein